MAKSFSIWDGKLKERKYTKLARVAKLHGDGIERALRPKRAIVGSTAAPRITSSTNPEREPGEVSVGQASALLQRCTQTVIHAIKKAARCRLAAFRGEPAATGSTCFVRTSSHLDRGTQAARRVRLSSSGGVSAAEVYACRLEGLTIAQIAVKLGISERAVSNRIAEWL